jgi:carbon-monoxide dehydrogenase small subunit
VADAAVRPLTFGLNGHPVHVEVADDRLLLHLLRDDLDLTGTKEGCSVGVCGLCSVLVDRRLMSACLLPAVFVDGADVTTIEGLAMADGALSPLQDAFIRTGGFQCGICTPGQIVAATALLAEDPTPDGPTTREWMKGNLCRCTGYDQIVEAIVGVGQ